MREYESKQDFYKNWIHEKTFESKREASIESEKIWSYHYDNKSDAGVRVTFRCNLMKFRGKRCASGLYLLYDSTCTDIHLHRADAAHTHDDEINKGNAVDPISGEMEAEIRSLFADNMKPNAILYRLVNKGFTPPAKTKLTTFLSKIREEKFGKEK